MTPILSFRLNIMAFISRFFLILACVAGPAAADLVPPGPPTNVSAIAEDGAATVSFDSPLFEGSGPIFEYEVYANGTSVARASLTSIYVGNLNNGESYTFTVVAYNDYGGSDPSAESNAVTPQAPQTITFDNPGTQYLGTSPTLLASSDSGLPVTYSAGTLLVCDVTSDGQLTLISAGECWI